MAVLKIYNPIIAEEQRLDLYCFCGIEGVTFKDVDEFIASIAADDDTIDVRLHCLGGDVAEGWAIVDKLLTTGKTIITTIEGHCASMATVLLLAASVRKGAKHATMLIHDPYYPEYTLAGAYRAEDLDKLAESLRNDTTKILDFYVERTGADRVALEALMKEDKFINMQEAQELGFIHEILEPRSASAAKVVKSASEWKKHTSNNQISNSMSKTKNNKGAIAKAIALLASALGVDTPRAADYELNTAAGETITIDKPEGEDPAVGDSASPDGEHAMPDGTTIVIADGAITEIRDAEGDEEGEDDELATAQARVAELEAEVDTLRKNAKTTADLRILNAVKIAGGEAWLAKAKSEYKPQGRASSATPTPKADPPARLSKVRKQLDALQKKNEAAE